MAAKKKAAKKKRPPRTVYMRVAADGSLPEGVEKRKKDVPVGDGESIASYGLLERARTE
jgi:hypothetical protein